VKENFVNWVRFVKFWGEYADGGETTLRSLYWDKRGCDHLPHKFDVVVADLQFHCHDEEIVKRIIERTQEDSSKIFGEDEASRYLWIVCILKWYDHLDDLRSFNGKGREWSKHLSSLFQYLASDFTILSKDPSYEKEKSL
jgi:hypothetical protein